jgi:hypothetical protein
LVGWLVLVVLEFELSTVIKKKKCKLSWTLKKRKVKFIFILLNFTYAKYDRFGIQSMHTDD